MTGAARRVGAVIAARLHAEGMNVVLHYRRSEAEATALCATLNAKRRDSATLAQVDLADVAGFDSLVKAALQWGSLDLLVNNASSFNSTPIGNVTEADWDDIMDTNLKAPFFLSQAAAPYLRRNHGSIINIVDIYGQRPLREHTAYSVSKAGLDMLTRSLARELGPDVRVNGIAPGAILWPEQGLDGKTRKAILDRTALQRVGSPDDIAGAVVYLARDAGYVTGQILTVDGGRNIGW
ncbi:MAG TPA: pteridine reductase [Gammaproteobacteria bacterium]|nr:pteridine reductase [Gammaproteobacteria bacterium]